MLRYIILFLGIQIGFAQSGNGIHSNVRFNRLGVEEGLSQSSVLCIFQDNLGFMWFGTRDGLNKYDGYSFEVFRHQIQDTTSISGNIVIDVVEDSQGTLWIATENGLSAYDRGDNHFMNYNYGPEEEPLRKINDLFIDGQNRLWVGGVFGLLGFDRETERFFEPDIVTEHLSQYPGFNVNTITEDAQGNLWFGTGDFGVYTIDQYLRTGRKITLSDPEKFESRIEVIKVDENRGLWLGSYGEGLFFVDFQGNIQKHYHEAAPEPYHLANNNIRALLKDKDGRLWVGTFGGLTVLDKDGASFTVPFEKDRPEGLAHNSVRSLALDEKGSVWIGTYFGGINMYDLDNQRFSFYSHSIKNPNSLSFNVVGAFTENRDGHLLVGTERGGINLVEKDDMTHQVLGGDQYTTSTIKALCTDIKGIVWAGVFKQGLHRYDTKTNALIPYPQGQPKMAYLKRAIVNRIVDDGTGHLWIGTDAMGGLHRFDRKNGKYVPYPHQEELSTVLGHSAVKDVTLLGNGKVLIATRGKGIVEFDTKDGSISVMTTFRTQHGSLKIDQFNSVLLDGKQRIWLASDGGGLLVREPGKNTFQHYSTSNGLANNVVYGCLEDKGSIWAVTLNGVSKMDIKGNKVAKNYTRSSGFPLNEVNEGAFFKADDGRFLIGGNNGYVSFSPNTLHDNRYVPRMVFTGISVMNRRILPGDGSGILKTEINGTRHITLQHSQSVFTLEFAALSYLKPENNTYRYKLEGFDEDWIDLGNRQSVTYTNLRSGDYTFFVKGSNNDGVWNEKPISLGIEVLPPPWRTWWAFLLYVLATVSVLYWIRKYTLRSERLKQSLRIEQLEKDKWKEIHDLKLKYFIDVSHEIRTPLTLILTPLEELLGLNIKTPNVKGLVKTMYLNAKRLLLLIDQILELREIETGHLKLKKEALYLTWHVEEIFNSFRAFADRRKIKLSLLKESSLPDIPVLFDKDKIEKIFYNLMSNAFKFTPKGGEIALEIKGRQNGDRIAYVFTLRDTGVGIPSDLLPRIFERFQKSENQAGGAGIGLALTKSLVELMKGSIKAESVEGKGATFILECSFEVVGDHAEWPTKQQDYVHPVPLEYDADKIPLQEDVEVMDDQKPLILIVEDNVEMRAYLKEKLGRKYKVVTAPNGKKGVAKAKKYGPDLIISDVMMPVMDGLELCRIIKTSKELSHIPVLLLTARKAQYNTIEGLEHGADDYVSKPFDLTELKLRIKNMLNNRLRVQQRFEDLSMPMLPKEKLLQPFDEKLMKSIISTIQRNIEQPNFTVEALGEKVGLSRVHLFRKLKSLTGKTPSEFIRDIRMKNAGELLKTRQYRLAEVADMVGFQDVKYFGKCFKKFYGLSPTEYVNTHAVAMED